MLIICICPMRPAFASHWAKAVLRWVDSSDVAGCDTMYVRLPHEGFVASIRTTVAGTSSRVGLSSLPSFDLTSDVSGTLRGRPSTMLGVGITYRGWGLSWSHDFSPYGDTDFSYSFYSQRYGLEYRYHDAYTLHGAIGADGSEAPEYLVDLRDGRARTTEFNAYWVFDHRHFSHPAATIYTVRQLRSSGSWLAGVNYWHGSYRSYLTERPLGFNRLSLSHINVGGGYAYNYVFGSQRCLLHGSLVPMLSIWHRDRLYFEPQAVSLHQAFSFDVVGHFHFVCNLDRYVIAWQNLWHLSQMPFNNGAWSITSYDWQSHLSFGIRF